MLIIVFSFNRAMQLDTLLKSIINRCKNIDYEIKVIYHTTGSHNEAYNKLKQSYIPFGKISFLERGFPGLLRNISFSSFRTLRDFYRFFNAVRNKRKIDNFKRLLDKTISFSKKDLLMFCTDDSYFYRDVFIPEEVYNNIINKPSEYSYRMYIGDNCVDFPESLKITRNNYFIWNYFDSKLGSHWNYPFSVDATLYNRLFLLKCLKKFFFYDPSTLEGYGNYYTARKKLFASGTGPEHSFYVNLPINGVSTSTGNYQGNVNVDFLKDKYLDGYELEYILPEVVNMHALIPDEIKLRKSVDIIRILKNEIGWEKRKN